jgi:hypothetical protein
MDCQAIGMLLAGSSARKSLTVLGTFIHLPTARVMQIRQIKTTECHKAS